MDNLIVSFVAFADIDPDQPEGSEARWVARSTGPHNSLKGLFAFGPDFPTARQNLARVVLTAVQDHPAADSVTAVRVHAVTHKTFPVASLKEGS